MTQTVGCMLPEVSPRGETSLHAQCRQLISVDTTLSNAQTSGLRGKCAGAEAPGADPHWVWDKDKAIHVH